nr:restriction endonuclease [Dyella sp. ASV24]
MGKMWMIRGDGGSLYEEFRERSIAAIGWVDIAADAKPGMTREALTQLYQAAHPHAKKGRAISGASQVWRFLNEIAPDDDVVTYSPENRTYLLGKVTGPARYQPDTAEEGMALVRPVEWREGEISRDDLTIATKNSLGATLTIFVVPSDAAQDILAVAAGRPATVDRDEDVAAEDVSDPYADIHVRALERIKDKVNELSWDEMQELVAGILRAMNYKTQVSARGSDRGKDILASPDGFGFEHPRILVEVRHRRERMGSADIRSFLGGRRHEGDRGLYVSTGGFTKEALYEAERASIPLVLWTLDQMVRALMDCYDRVDLETRRLVPLKPLYWPA